MIRLHFLGAARQVTGSRYCLQADGVTLLVDCGMFQERALQERNWQPGAIPARQIGVVVLTHAHIDHCGLLPRLVGDGFGGPVYCTRPTASLAEVILQDAARIQLEDAVFKQERHRKEGRRGRHPVVPLFDERDVSRVAPLLEPVPYNRPIPVSPQVQLTFRDAGHILGSAMVELNIRSNGAARQIVFSGDIGQWDKPLLRDPTLIDRADYVVMESTYGDRNHLDAGQIETQLADVIRSTVARGGNVVIPTFAVERSQELMYYIGRLLRARRIEPVKVFLDSPMAVDVTTIFERHRDAFDGETWELIAARRPPLCFPGLQLVRSIQQSKAINRLTEPVIIMATSGMCTAGRIKHHLVHNIARPESTVLIVGYQARGTLGRQILDGQPYVRIHGREWPVRARIAQIHGFSGHADRDDLMRWVGHFQTPPRNLFLTHGEEEVSLSLAEHIRRQYGWDPIVPHFGDAADLA